MLKPGGVCRSFLFGSVSFRSQVNWAELPTNQASQIFALSVPFTSPDLALRA